MLLEEYLTSATSILEPYADSEDVAYEQLFYLAEAYVLGTLIPMGLISDAEDAINSMPYLRESDVAYFRQQFPSTAAQPENEISCEADTPSAQAPHVKREGSDDATDDRSMHQSPQAPSDSWIDNFWLICWRYNRRARWCDCGCDCGFGRFCTENVCCGFPACSGVHSVQEGTCFLGSNCFVYILFIYKKAIKTFQLTY